VPDATAEYVLFALGLAAGPVLFLGALIFLNGLLAPKQSTPEKLENYECGIPQAGSPWAPVNIRFFRVALLFVLFDAEAVLLFAVAPALRGSLVGLAEFAAFTALLALGLAYAWRKGALEWPS